MSFGGKLKLPVTGIGCVINQLMDIDIYGRGITLLDQEHTYIIYIYP